MKALNFCFALVLSVFSLSAANIVYVNSAVPSGDGSSWQTPLRSIPEAIAKVQTDGGEVWIASGTYQQDGGRTNSFTVPNKVTLVGGFTGNELSKDDRKRVDISGNGIIEPWEFSHQTILSGRQTSYNPLKQDYNTLYHVVQFTSTNTDLNSVTTGGLDGLIIEGGLADSINAINYEHGAGIAINGTSYAQVHIRNCIIRNNTASGNGGGLYVSSQNQSDRIAIITGSCFYGNVCGGQGGAIAVEYYASVNINNSYIYSNKSLAPATVQGGGAIYASVNFNNNPSATEGRISLCVNSSVIFNNEAASQGAIAYKASTKSNGSDSVYVTNTFVARNYSTATSSGLSKIEGNKVYWSKVSGSIFYANSIICPTCTDDKERLELTVSDTIGFIINNNIFQHVENESLFINYSAPLVTGAAKDAAELEVLHKINWRPRFNDLLIDKTYATYGDTIDMTGMPGINGANDIGPYENNSAALELTDSAMVKISQAYTYNQSNSFTVQFRFKASALGESVLFTMVDKNDNTKKYTGIVASISGKYYIKFTTPAGELISTREIVADQWQQVTLAANQYNTQLYINGKLVSNNPMSIPILMGDQLFYIGGYSPGRLTIDEFSTYSRCKTSTEIEQDLHSPIDVSSNNYRCQYLPFNRIENCTFKDEWSPLYAGTTLSQCDKLKIVNSSSLYVPYIRDVFNANGKTTVTWDKLPIRGARYTFSRTDNTGKEINRIDTSANTISFDEFAPGQCTYTVSTSIDGEVLSDSRVFGAANSTPAAIFFNNQTYCEISTGINQDSTNCPIYNASAYTVETWFKTLDAGRYQTLIAMDNGTGPQLRISKNNEIDALFTYNNDSIKTKISSLPITKGEWYHVAITHDTDNSNKLYVNGTLIGTSNIESVPKRLILGVRYGSNSYIENSFTGLLDETRFWNKALTQAELLENIYHEIPANSTSKPVAYYRYMSNNDSVVTNSIVPQYSGKMMVKSQSAESLFQPSFAQLTPCGITINQTTCGTTVSWKDYDASNSFGVIVAEKISKDRLQVKRLARNMYLIDGAKPDSTYQVSVISRYNDKYYTSLPVEYIAESSSITDPLPATLEYQYCVGDLAKITPATSGITYKWEYVAYSGFSEIIEDEETYILPNLGINDSTTIYYSVTYADGCTDATTIKLKVGERPEFAPMPDIYSAIGRQVTFSPQSVNFSSGISYKWFHGNKFVSDVSNYSFPFAADSAGMYILESFRYDGCMSKDTVNVKIFDVVFASSHDTICNDNQIDLSANASSEAGELSYVWRNALGDTLSKSAGFSFIPSENKDSVYKFAVTASLLADKSLYEIDTVKVTVLSKPSVVALYDTVCRRESSIVLPDEGIYQYNGETISNIISVSDYPLVFNKFDHIVGQGACTSKSTFELLILDTVRPSPLTFSYTESAVPSTIKSEDFWIKWYDESNNFLASGSEYTHGKTAPGIYLFNIAIEKYGCLSEKSPVTLTIAKDVIEKPIIASSNIQTCIGELVPINATGLGDIVWYQEDTLSTPIYTGSQLSIAKIEPGVYRYFARCIVGIKESYATEVAVSVHPQPLVQLAPQYEATTGTAVSLKAYPLAADVLYTYKWSPASKLVTSEEAQVRTLPITQNEVFILTVTDATSGCSKTTETSVISLAAVVPVTAIRLPANAGFVTGESLQLEATVIPDNATNKSVIWKTSNPAVAAISTSGILTALAPGVSVITAMDAHGTTAASMLATVTETAVAPQSISLPDSVIVQLISGTYQFSATVLPYNATYHSMSWQIDYDTIATVENLSGRATLVAPGKATVTVSIPDANISTQTTFIVRSSAPIAQIKPLPILVSETDATEKSFDLSSYFADDSTAIDELKLEIKEDIGLSVALVDGRAVFTGMSLDQQSGTVPMSADKVYEFTLVITDGEGNVTEAPMTIMMVDVKTNSAPIVAKVAEQSPTVEGFAPVKLADIISDDFTMPEDVIWAPIENENLYVDVDADGIMSVKPRLATWEGVDTIRIVATDKQGATSIVEIIYNSEAINKAPQILDIPNQNRDAVSEFTPIYLNTFVADDNTAPKDIIWNVSPSDKLNFSITNNKAVVSIADQSWVGTEVITFVATDASGLSSSYQVAFTQMREPAIPVEGQFSIAFSAPRRIASRGGSVQLIADIKGATEWKWLLDGIPVNDSSALTPMITLADIGKYDISLVVRNGENADTLTKEKYLKAVGIASQPKAICLGDSIVLTTSDSSFADYKWNNGSNEKTVKIAPTQTGYHSLLITNVLFSYRDSVLVAVIQPVKLPSDTSICIGDSVTLYPGKYKTYLWSNGATDTSMTVNTPGNYSLTTTDVYGCTTTDTFAVIKLHALPQVSLGDDFKMCDGKKSLLSAGKSLKYLWDNGATTSNITIDTTGTYSVTVSDANGCSNSDTVTATFLYPFAEQLGMASFSDDGKSIITAWNRTSGKRTERYEIWREDKSSGNYIFVGEAGYNDSLRVIDRDANALQQAFRYKLVTIDSVCANKAESKPHRTLHLTAEKTANEAILKWSDYLGIDVKQYYIFKLSSSELSVIDTLDTDGSESYTYTYSEHKQGDKYRIAFDLNEKLVLSALKNDSGPFSQSMSNLSEAIVLSGVMLANTSVYAAPNPTAKTAKMYVPEDFGAKYIKVLDNLGDIALQSTVTDSGDGILISLEHLPVGTYTVQIFGNGGMEQIVVVKE